MVLGLFCEALCRTATEPMTQSMPACHKEIVQRPEYQRDVPAIGKALDQAEQKRWQTEQLEAGKKNGKRRMVDRQAGKEQIADDADDI